MLVGRNSHLINDVLSLLCSIVRRKTSGSPGISSFPRNGPIMTLNMWLGWRSTKLRRDLTQRLNISLHLLGIACSAAYTLCVLPQRVAKAGCAHDCA